MMHASPIPVQKEHFIDVLKTPVVDKEPQPKEVDKKLVEPPPAPQLPADAASALQDLISVDRLLIKKRLRVKSVLFLRGKKNRFTVQTPNHTQIYTIEEQNRWWVGYFCYGLRPLQLMVSNRDGEVVMKIERPYACTTRVLPCQLQTLKIFAPVDHLIGTVEQQWTAVKPLYVVKNTEGNVVFWIKGPLVTLSFFNDLKFRITRADGSPVGTSCKRWQGLVHAIFFAPVTDKYNIMFDMDLPVEEKALLLAAIMLMDYMYYAV